MEYHGLFMVMFPSNPLSGSLWATCWSTYIYIYTVLICINILFRMDLNPTIPPHTEQSLHAPNPFSNSPNTGRFTKASWHLQRLDRFDRETGRFVDSGPNSIQTPCYSNPTQPNPSPDFRPGLSTVRVTKPPHPHPRSSAGAPSRRRGAERSGAPRAAAEGGEAPPHRATRCRLLENSTTAILLPILIHVHFAVTVRSSDFPNQKPWQLTHNKWLGTRMKPIFQDPTSQIIQMALGSLVSSQRSRTFMTRASMIFWKRL